MFCLSIFSTSIIQLINIYIKRYHKIMEISCFRCFTPVQSPCFFVNPIDKNFIYPYARYVVIEPKDQKQHFLRGHSTNINCINMSPKGRMIASGESGRDADVIVWNYEKKDLLFKLSEHNGTITAIAFSRDERLLATSAEDDRLIIWDMATGNVVTHKRINRACLAHWGGRVPDHKGRPTQIFFLATSGPKGVELHEIDPSNGSINTTMLPQGKYRRTITSLAFTATHLLCGTTSADVLAFELHSKILSYVNLTQTGSGITSIFESPIDGGVIAGTSDGSIFTLTENNCSKLSNLKHPVSTLYDDVILAADGYLLNSRGDKIWECHPCEVTSIDVCGSKVVTSAVDKVIKIWDQKNLQCTCSFSGSPRSEPTAVSLNTNILIAGFGSGSIGGYDNSTGEELFTILHGHLSKVSALEISPTKRFFCSGGEDATVRFWDIKTRTMYMNLKHHNDVVTAVRYLPSSNYAYSSSNDTSICLIDIDQEKMIDRISCFDSGVRDIDVHDQELVACSLDGCVSKFVVSQSLKPVVSIKSAEANTIAYSPDGSKIAVGHLNGSITLHNSSDLQKICELDVHSSAVADMRFNEYGIFSAGMDGGIANTKV